MSGKRSNDFLARFTGKIAVINKNGEMHASEPPTPFLPILSRLSQIQHRSTASTINERRVSHNKSWVYNSNKDNRHLFETRNSNKTTKMKEQIKQNQKNYSISTIKTPFLYAANNLMNSQQDLRSSYHQEEAKKSNSLSWVFKDKETNTFYQKLESLPFAKISKDTPVYRT